MKPICLFALLFCLPTLATANRPSRNDLWKHGLKGPVKTCRTTCFQYKSNSDGTKTLERGLLEYAGDAYDVDTYYAYDEKGFVKEEKLVPFDVSGPQEKKTYERDKDGRILHAHVYQSASDEQVSEKHKYEYDRIGRLMSISRYDPKGSFVETIEKFQYNGSGYMIVNWTEDEINYTSLINQDGKCMEEIGIFRTGEEYFHNYHQYDSQSGKRIRTTYTVDKKIVEVRDNPYSDNILDEGKIISRDMFGNWVSMTFQSEDSGGAMVVREIVYYP